MSSPLILHAMSATHVDGCLPHQPTQTAPAHDHPIDQGPSTQLLPGRGVDTLDPGYSFTTSV